MKKLILLFLVLFLKFAPAKAQWVTIPDPNFVDWLNWQHAECMSGNQMDTTCAGIVNAASANINDENILNLTGIQYFDNLLVLNCAYNYLVNLPSLPNLLRELYCVNNNLTSLPQLPNSLEVLFCYDNELNYLPTLPSSLWILDCSNNQLTNLPSLPNELNDINCSYNQITSLPPLSGVNGGLIINNNQISCIDYLPIFASGDISNNLLTCVPNQTDYSLGLPLCVDNDVINNPNNCLSISNISGNVFNDNNNNCIFNSSIDLGSNNIQMKLFDNQNNLLAQSYSTNGVYGFSVNTNGIYKVKFPTYNTAIAISCSQSDSQLVNLSNLNSVISNINFPIVCNDNNDVFIQSVTSQGIVFPNQIHTLRTNISTNETWYNLICDKVNTSGIVTITIDGPIDYIAPSLGALLPQISGNTFVYDITDFNVLTPESFGLRLRTDTTAQANDRICVHVEISPNPIDADTTNNVYDFCYNVVNSYDPNMKEVYPINVLPGYDDWFTYTIHFQNTGNAPAFNIRLRDTLDTQLDLNTFEVLGYSHPANVTVSGNILTVRFNNIMLPDSTTDYEGSMGYFQYRIKPLPNLPNGSQISNTAYIYFDYNTPIITNTTENNFDITVPVKSLDTTENSFSLFPNPSSGVFTFKDTKNLNSVEVYSVLGAKILSQTNQKTINLNGFSKGVYFARVNGGVVLKMVKE
jgi:uncharacterized repeat protein (TIGR01451 family)